MYKMNAFYVSHRKGILQGAKYLVTGGTAFVADFSVYWLINLFMHYMIAVYIGLLVGLVVNYIMSKHWVFKNKNAIDTREVTSFITVTAAGFALTGALMYIGVNLLGADENLSKFIVAIIIFILNFLARKFIIWKEE